VYYAENRVEIEVVPVAGTPKKALAARPKNRNTALASNRGFGGGKANGSSPNGTSLSSKAKITLQLRPAKFSPN
jgi:hypothetical protein